MSQIILVASGDLRESANVVCWPTQKAMETKLTEVLAGLGHELIRAHPEKPEGHGFISSQREGMDIFATIDRDAPLIIAEAVWQYSHHVLPGLTTHRGPILTVANWSGQYPGLVGLLNINASMTKAQINYSTIWSESFEDDFFFAGLKEWLGTGKIIHDASHVRSFDGKAMNRTDHELVSSIVEDIRHNKVIMGVFDEGCMGMYNAIIPDELLMPMGIFKERLSQSTLYHSTLQVSEEEARAAYQWMLDKGMTFHIGPNPSTDLTESQVLNQCRMYIAAVRLADQFGCEAIGIQYQQGMKDLLPASDLAEGMLNNEDRPDVKRADGSVIRQGQAIVHFNEVDECSGLDGILINRLHRALGQPVENTLHDIRWGSFDPTGSSSNYVWVFEISGAVPPAHHEGGWSGSESMRQPKMYFPSGGGSLRGIAKAGDIIWSRIFVQEAVLHMDIGRGQAVELSNSEMTRRSQSTTPEWPIMNAVLNGVDRDQMMARHKANHIQVVYAHSAEDADRAMLAKATLAKELGIEVHLCGV